MKVLLINGGFPLDKVGGSELQTFYIGRSLVQSGDEVHYLAISSSVPEQAVEFVEGMAVHRVSKLRSVRERRRMLRTLLESGDFDLCYVRIIGWLGDVVDIAHSQGVAVVSNVASDMDLIRQPVLPRLLSGKIRSAWNTMRLNKGSKAFVKCDAVVAQTNTQREALIAMGVRTSEVIRNMFPEEIPRATSVETPEILFVGSIKGVKRPEAFIALASSLSAADSRFVIIGEVQDRSYQEIVVHAMETLPNLSYEGARPIDDTWGRIAAARILVNTSRHEGFPNTFIQAWLAGVPVVTLGIDPDGVIEREGLGFVCATQDELTLRVDELVRDDALWSTLSQNAGAYARREHTVRVSGPRFRALFERVSGCRR